MSVKAVSYEENYRSIPACRLRYAVDIATKCVVIDLTSPAGVVMDFTFATPDEAIEYALALLALAQNVGGVLPPDIPGVVQMLADAARAADVEAGLEPITGEPIGKAARA